MEQQGLQIELKWTHVGQRHAYGDTFRECEVHTQGELDENTILKLCGNGAKLPKAEWQKRTGNMGDYFRGYYTIIKTDYGYKYTGVEPYDD